MVVLLFEDLHLSIYQKQNLTNRKNPVRQFYDAGIGGIKYNYLLGLIPVVGYKVDF